MKGSFVTSQQAKTDKRRRHISEFEPGGGVDF